MKSQPPTLREQITDLAFRYPDVNNKLAKEKGTWQYDIVDQILTLLKAAVPEKYPEVGVTQNQIDFARGHNSAVNLMYERLGIK